MVRVSMGAETEVKATFRNGCCGFDFVSGLLGLPYAEFGEWHVDSSR